MDFKLHFLCPFDVVSAAGLCAFIKVNSRFGEFDPYVYVVCVQGEWRGGGGGGPAAGRAGRHGRPLRLVALASRQGGRFLTRGKGAQTAVRRAGVRPGGERDGPAIVNTTAQEEIMVKTVDNKLLVHAKHEESAGGKSVYR